MRSIRTSCSFESQTAGPDLRSEALVNEATPLWAPSNAIASRRYVVPCLIGRLRSRGIIVVLMQNSLMLMLLLP